MMMTTKQIMESQDSSPKRKKKKKRDFKVWPVPKKPDVPYGPRPKQSLLFIDDLPLEDLFVPDPPNDPINIKRPHLHPLDIVLYIGGARSGKTTAAVARTIDFLMRNKGAIAVVGATNFPLLQRTALREWQDRFTNLVPWDYMKLPEPPILKKPSQNDKRAVLFNGSQAYFLHFDNPEVLRGIDADIIHFEEACLLPDEAAYDELTRRLSGTRGKIRQLILTTNPEGKGGWISEKFKLHQLRADYNGVVEPIVDPCSCHLCQSCLNHKVAAPEYEDGVCPNCGSKKENDCPGNQVFVRVIQTQTSDNPNIPQDHAQSLRGTMDKKSYRVFVEGSTEDLRDGEIYKAYDDDNVYRIPEPVSYEKDLIWTLDFNFEPQCSVICQEEETSNGFVIKVLDEIILWNALPAHAAEEFCERFKDWNQAAGRSVLIYGDPAGLYGTGNDLVPSFYQIIYDILKKNGFDARIMMRKPDPDAYVKEPLKIPVAGRVDALNAMLRSADDPPQIRLRLNPQCRHVIRSLRELRWADDGKTIDKSVDKRAARKPDKEGVMVMTHPTDALGYYVYKRFPVVKHKKGVTFFQIPGEQSVEIHDGKVVSIDRRDRSALMNQEKQKRKEERRKARDARKAKREAALGQFLREQGLWPGQGPSTWFF